MAKAGFLASKHFDICIYHANCPDGFGAAWAVYRLHGNKIKYVEGHSYKMAPVETYKGLDVLLVDYCWEVPYLEAVLEVASSVTVVDHHETAMLNLACFDYPNFNKFFDMTKSGAGLAWHLFHPGIAPKIIKLVEDYDLFKFDYPETNTFNLALTSYPFDFKFWDRIDVNKLADEGKSIERWMDIQINRLCSNPVNIKIKNYIVPSINAPRCFVDRAGNLLSEGHPFSVVWAESGDKVHFSLRSREGSVLVNKVAEYFGGRGHPHAAVFALKKDDERLKDIFDV